MKFTFRAGSGDLEVSPSYAAGLLTMHWAFLYMFMPLQHVINVCLLSPRVCVLSSWLMMSFCFICQKSLAAKREFFLPTITEYLVMGILSLLSFSF